jgi:hypothetical protein
MMLITAMLIMLTREYPSSEPMTRRRSIREWIERECIHGKQGGFSCGCLFDAVHSAVADFVLMHA